MTTCCYCGNPIVGASFALYSHQNNPLCVRCNLNEPPTVAEIIAFLDSGGFDTHFTCQAGNHVCSVDQLMTYRKTVQCLRHADGVRVECERNQIAEFRDANKGG